MLSDHSPTTLPQLKAINSQLIHVKYVSHVRYKSNISPLNASIHWFCLVLPKRLSFPPSSHPSHGNPS